MKKQYLLTPGPTPIPPNVAQKSALPILHHRTSEYSEIFMKAIESLKWAFQTKGDVFVLASSGTGAMEASVANLLSAGDKALVATCGKFGDRWAGLCKAYGIDAEVLKVEWGKPVDPKAIEESLKKTPNIKAVFTTHTETSTGTVNDIKEIGRIVSKSNAVLAVDAVSSLGGQELKMDEWKIDIVVSGSQKGLMNAPGLAFVAISSEKARKLIEASKQPRYYFDFKKMKKSMGQKTTPFTPAVTLVIAQLEALEMLKNIGIENLWAKYAKLAKAAQAAFKAIGLKLFSSSPSNVITAACVPEGIDGGKIVKKLREEHGISIAGGQEQLKGKIIRLAHMGFMDKFDLSVGFTGIEIVLSELGYKVDKGKAIAALEEVLK